jgi:4-amino-4-deoxy-L-arabinose transferase-like glycosyltransferase
MAIVCGLAIATKISSLLYLAIPGMIILLIERLMDIAKR